MKVIQKHLNNINSTLNEFYKLTSISNHSGSLGTARELIIKYFLESNLPSSIDFTSGEVFDSKDNRSGQLDIIIHKSTSMKLNIANGIDLLPVDNVVATVECKSDLKAGSMKKNGRSPLKLALDACVKVKQLERINPLGIDSGYLKNNKMPDNMPLILLEQTGLLSTVDKTPYMIVAFKGPTEKKLREALWEYMVENSIDLDLMPNVITVLNQGYYLVKNDGFFMKKVKGGVHWSSPSEGNSTLIGMYMYLMKLSEATSLSNNYFPVKEYMSGKSANK